MTRGAWRQLDGWKARAVGLLREAFPADLDGVPIYLADAAELPPHFDLEGVSAYTQGYLDLALQPYLPAWEGRGFGAVCFPNRVDEYNLLGTIVHEFTHYCQFLVLSGLRGTREVELMTLPVDEMTPDQRLEADRCVDLATTRIDDDVPLWYSHDLLFTWGAINAAYRAWEAGLTDSYTLVNFAGPVYGLSPKSEYLHMAGDRPRELAGKSLLEAMLVDCPVAMQVLFDLDTSPERLDKWQVKPTT